MHCTVSLTENRDFKRLYTSDRSAVNAYLAVYCRRNRMHVNRLGLTVSPKVGKAVVRNRVRRRVKESYRLMEDRLRPGYDIVIVARVRAAGADYRQLDGALRALLQKLTLFEDGQ